MTTLHDQHGHRKYLTPAERDAFLNAADESEVCEVRTFCATLAHTGCRISEALALTADRIDLKDGTIVIESEEVHRDSLHSNERVLIAEPGCCVVGTLTTTQPPSPSALRRTAKACALVNG